MITSSHRIRRLRWAVTTDTAATAFGLRQQLRQRWETDLLPILNTVFDHAADDYVLHLPKLEIHVQATADNLWDTLPEQIYEQIQEQLGEYLSSPTATRLTTDNPTGAVILDQSTVEPAIAEPAAAERSCSEQKWLERFLHYVHTGSLPWDIVDLPASDIAAELQQVWRQCQRPVLLQHLNQSSLASSRLEASVYFRLMQLVPVVDRPELVQTLMDQINAQWRTALTTFLNTWLAFEQPSEHLRLSLAATVLAISLDPSHGNELPDLSAITTTHPNSTILVPLLQTFLPSLPDAVTSVLGLYPEQLLNTSAPLQEGVADQSNKVTVADSPNAPEQSQGLVADQSGPTQPSDQMTGSDTSSTTKESAPQTIQTDEQSLLENNLDLQAYISPPTPKPTDELPLRVPHAGLVLLHGFIPHFFESTGIELTDERQIVPECLPRAAALLHHLATDNPSIYEYELALIKLLVGLEPHEDLVVAEGFVNEEDRNEALELLQSAISYWSVLKNTSPNTLQSTFLQRYGLLYPGEQGWHLRVEGQAFDILLNHLPWSISLIKLPWMPRPLYTEWTLP